MICVLINDHVHNAISSFVARSEVKFFRLTRVDVCQGNRPKHNVAIEYVHVNNKLLLPTRFIYEM